MARFWSRIREMIYGPAAGEEARDAGMSARRPGAVRDAHGIDEEIGAVVEERVKHGGAAELKVDGAWAKRERSTVTVRYTGKLARPGRRLYLHYGFGPAWEETSEVSMAEASPGVYEATVPVASRRGSLAFCFRTEDGEWDNREGRDWFYPL